MDTKEYPRLSCSLSSMAEWLLFLRKHLATFDHNAHESVSFPVAPVSFKESEKQEQAISVIIEKIQTKKRERKGFWEREGGFGEVISGSRRIVFGPNKPFKNIFDANEALSKTIERRPKRKFRGRYMNDDYYSLTDRTLKPR